VKRTKPVTQSRGAQSSAKDKSFCCFAAFAYFASLREAGPVPHGLIHSFILRPACVAHAMSLMSAISPRQTPSPGPRRAGSEPQRGELAKPRPTAWDDRASQIPAFSPERAIPRRTALALSPKGANQRSPGQRPGSTEHPKSQVSALKGRYRCSAVPQFLSQLYTLIAIPHDAWRLSEGRGFSPAEIASPPVCWSRASRSLRPQAARGSGLRNILEALRRRG